MDVEHAFAAVGWVRCLAQLGRPGAVAERLFRPGPGEGERGPAGRVLEVKGAGIVDGAAERGCDLPWELPGVRSRAQPGELVGIASVAQPALRLPQRLARRASVVFQWW